MTTKKTHKNYYHNGTTTVLLALWPCLPHYSQEGEKVNERLPWGSGKLATFMKAVTPLKASAVGLQNLTVSKQV